MSTPRSQPSPQPSQATSVLAAAWVHAGADTEAARSARRHTLEAFEGEFGDLAGWASAPLPRRLAAPVSVRGFTAWAALRTGTELDVDYVAAVASDWGHHAALLHPEVADTFRGTAERIGFSTPEARRQWALLGQLIAVAGCVPRELHRPVFDAARDHLAAAITASRGRVTNSFTTPLHGLEATLAALGVLDTPAPRRPGGRQPEMTWETLAVSTPTLSATMRRYLGQLAVSLRPGSVALIDTTLRIFAGYLHTHHPEITTAASVRRTHIEGFKAYLNARPGYRGHRQLSKTTLGMRIGHLRGFFDRIIEWGYPDAPDRNPVFAGDTPIRDRPLPRFLDDADATKLLTAARTLPDLFDRVAVEVLARTGLRKGEFLALGTDAVVSIGDGNWLRTPVGKLHTDRYIPLHPRVKTLLEEWIAQRGEQPNTRLMFTDRGRSIPGSRVDKAVRAAAATAGIGHVTPHQLRHTLATQAINRGMSLEAIAALLGHRSMSMTLTYARIADRTVAKDYFAVTEKIEALYLAEPTLPSDAEGPNMRRLRDEATCRLLGNGYCSRPRDVGCRYETICETCTFFVPTIAFRDQIQAQHNDATQHGDEQRQQAYANLLNKLERGA
jgi:integrase